jgi:hypothetical protein
VTLLSHNIVRDPGFDDPTKWTKIQGDGFATVQNSEAHVYAPTSTYTAVYDTTIAGVPGQQYLLRISATMISGTLGAVWGSTLTHITKSGVTQKLITATGTGGIELKRLGAAPPDEFKVHWVNVRRIGVDMSKLVLTMRDFDGDKRQTSIELGEVTDGTSYTTISGQASTLATAIQAVCAGKRAKQEFIATSTAPDDSNAANVLAQTAYRWIIEYNDAVTGDGPYQIDLPTPDLADNSLVLAGSHHHDPANAEWVTLKAAMEGGEVKNPRTGNNISITAIFLEQ